METLSPPAGFRTRPAEYRQRLDRGDTTFCRVRELIGGLIATGRPAEGRVLLRFEWGLASNVAESTGAIFDEAMIEARSGNRPGALPAIRRYEAMKLPSQVPDHSRSYQMGQIYAALGDTANAIAKLREAAALGDLGLRHQMAWHREFDSYILQLPAFQQLVGAGR